VSILGIQYFSHSLVHHLLLWGCDVPLNSTQTPIPCDMAPQHCENMALIPPNAPAGSGVPLGLGGYPAVVMQIHYHNPNLIEAVDNITRLHVVVGPRGLELGVLALGTEAIALPAQTTTSLRGQCTLANLPSTGIVPFYSFWHMHLLGRAMKTLVIRNGQQVAELGVQPHYDFSFQLSGGYLTLQPLPPAWQTEFRLFNGDVLITECDYDSHSRNNYTYIGAGSTDEMCYNFMSYYPLVNELAKSFQCIEDFTSNVAGCVLHACPSQVSACLGEPDCASFIDGTSSVTLLANLGSMPVASDLLRCIIAQCKLPIETFEALPPECSAAASTAGSPLMILGTLILLIFKW